jgi:hypothetical protein
MTQNPTAHTPAPPQTATPWSAPQARAGRLAARLRDKSLRLGTLSAALQDISVLDSGTLAALPRLAAALSDQQEQEPLPSDPFRMLAPASQPSGLLTRALPWKKPASRLPVLSQAQWADWQREVQRSSLRLEEQFAALSELQARQRQLLNDLFEDSETLALAAALLAADSALPQDWRERLSLALTRRVADLHTASMIAGQSGEAVQQLLLSHAELQGRLEVAAGLMQYAAQTGVSLQQALEQQAVLHEPLALRLKSSFKRPSSPESSSSKSSAHEPSAPEPDTE